ncbi:hypothetical protein EET67_09750 [Pseudaminobacter arsenicus]|uniref:Uncharacterized protein n=1 Tax=Borborobacter arsenicus TaxID=1851146 RepID=A0A432V734_9HYPH|nr:hypothetical protein [Pseudaminobacter arsenicus]RUM97893.1 hypothetical protein EET67_09750 [Pseudaminobacter arsenicus]
MPPAPISITIKVPPRAHQRLHEMAKPRGYTTTAYAQLLFDAAFAARVGQERDDPISDAELDEQVRLVFACAGQGDAAAIAKATGVPAARVDRILQALRDRRKRR